MTFQPLPDNCDLAQTVLPSVWAGYKMPPCKPMVELVDKTAEALQVGSVFSKEEADQISRCFWLGSVHDFCVQYFRGKLADEDHAKILQTANELIKNGTSVRMNERETDLRKVLALKVALNAHQRAHQTMLHACFLNEFDRLPKENMFMLQKGISPVFYEKDEFNRSQKLVNTVHEVPEDRLMGAFTQWICWNGARYIPAFNQMKELMQEMSGVNTFILKKSVDFCVRKKRITCQRYHYRSRFGCRRRRTYDE